MRISDWSSDVCSSDLRHRDLVRSRFNAAPGLLVAIPADPPADGLGVAELVEHQRLPARRRLPHRRLALGGDPDRRMRRLHRLRLDQDIAVMRSEEHTSELQSLMRISYAVFCLKK